MNQKQAESKPQDKKKVRNNMIRKILTMIDDDEEEEEQESKEENKERRARGEGKEGFLIEQSVLMSDLLLILSTVL